MGPATMSLELAVEIRVSFEIVMVCPFTRPLRSFFFFSLDYWKETTISLRLSRNALLKKKQKNKLFRKTGFSFSVDRRLFSYGRSAILLFFPFFLCDCFISPFLFHPFSTGTRRRRRRRKSFFAEGFYRECGFLVPFSAR